MTRPKCCRMISGPPGCFLFKPAGIPAADLSEVVLELDEWEAIRLADFEGLYHKQASERMNVSRQTFGRILTSARKKVAQALIEGKVLSVEGRGMEMPPKRTFRCYDCRHVWELPCGSGPPSVCPSCQSSNFHCSEEEEHGPNDAGDNPYIFCFKNAKEER